MSSLPYNGYWTSDGFQPSDEEAPSEETLGAGWVFATESAHILLVKDATSGKYGFCKGHAEPTDATLLDTARREAKEELGLNLGDYQIASDPFVLRSFNYEVEFRYAVLKKPVEELTLQKEEIAGTLLVSLQEMRQMPPSSLNRFARQWLRLVSFV
jgi:8-oxo-dGTP pyrophosphatase MutT (NUDIX family)